MKRESFYRSLVEAAKRTLRRFKFANPIEADAAAMAAVNREAKFLRRAAARGSMMVNRVRRRRAKNRLERDSRRINFAKARMA